jgi:hypothetical protein
LQCKINGHNKFCAHKIKWKIHVQNVDLHQSSWKNDDSESHVFNYNMWYTVCDIWFSRFIIFNEILCSTCCSSQYFFTKKYLHCHQLLHTYDQSPILPHHMAHSKLSTWPTCG